jgi:hypothetical protein
MRTWPRRTTDKDKAVLHQGDATGQAAAGARTAGGRTWYAVSYTQSRGQRGEGAVLIYISAAHRAA